MQNDDRVAANRPRTLMYAETCEAPLAVERCFDNNRENIRALTQKLRSKRPRAVVTAARGSSDNVATYARYLIETRLGILTSSIAPSIASVYSTNPDMENTLLLVISQSGRSPDLIATAKAAKQAGAFIVSVVNDASSPLAELADCCLPLYAGPERSVAATKTYLVSCAIIAELIAVWSGDEMLGSAVHSLPALMNQALHCDWSAALPVLTKAKDLYVVGRGVGFGATQEAALKFKETCSLHAEAFSAAEVRHGPMALVQTGFPTFVLAQDDAAMKGIKGLIDSFFANDASVILAGLEDPRAITLPALDAHPVIQPILLIQSFYIMAEALAQARGNNPDTPPHLNKVTETV